jgi:hypothetical protein
MQEEMKLFFGASTLLVLSLCRMVEAFQPQPPSRPPPMDLLLEQTQAQMLKSTFLRSSSSVENNNGPFYHPFIINEEEKEEEVEDDFISLSDEARRAIQYVENVGQFCQAMQWTLDEYEDMMIQLKQQRFELQQRTQAIDTLLLQCVELEEAPQQDRHGLPQEDYTDLSHLVPAVRHVVDVEVRKKKEEGRRCLMLVVPR